MSDLRETIRLEFVDREIVYLWQSFKGDEPVDFDLGAVSSGGSVRGVAFEDLERMGRGVHNFPAVTGLSAPNSTAPDGGGTGAVTSALKKMVLALLGYDAGIYTRREVECLVMLAFAPGDEETVLSFLTSDDIDFLKNFAAQIPDTKERLEHALKSEQTHWMGTYSSNVEIGQIPAENLWAIKELFS